MTYDCFSRYLISKKTVDDRSLNAHVWETMVESLPDRPLEILEIGAGVGTMIERFLERGVALRGTYTTVDADPTLAKVMAHRLQKIGFDQNQQLGGLQIQNVCADLHDFLEEQRGDRWDVVIAHAFMDLVSIPETVPRVLNLLKEGGVFYFSVTYDGEMALLPEIDPNLDEDIVRYYHQSMDERLSRGRPSGDSRSGRHLLVHLQELAQSVLAVGSSDWVVGSVGGQYMGDEAYFLHFIVDTIGNQLNDHPHLISQRFQNWITKRHEQIDQGKLIYLAHQLDIVGQF